MKQVLVVLLFALLLGCKKDSANEDVYVYSQTQCADKWTQGATDSITIDNMRSYLSSKGIVVLSAELTAAPVDRVFCLACTCSTGRAFRITVSDASIADLEKEGFYKVD